MPGVANVHERWERGAKVWWQTHRNRILDAIGEDVVKWISDFTSLPVDDTTGDPTEFTMTVVETGAGGDSTAALTDGSGGFLLLTTDNAENDGVSLQLKGESFQLKSTNSLYFRAKGLEINDVDQSDFFVGLAITDTAILGGVTDRIGFQSVDAAAAMTFHVEKDGNDTSVAAATLVDDTAVDLEFFWDGTNLYVYVDGAKITAPALTNLPDDEALRLSLEFLTGETTANTLKVDKLAVIQIGR